MTKYTLLTGATGLVGRYLIRDLLLRGEKLAVIVRPTKKLSAAERVESILQLWESQLDSLLPRPVCIEGDLRQTKLGLDEASLTWVSENCDRMIHSAAVLEFSETSEGEPWKTNVDGVKNMLSLCQAAGIRDLHHVSTAYVCGVREGIVMEEDLDVGQEFRNVYEESKCEAEKLVRQAEFLDHLTVYRPAVIAGDSKTGYTNTYHGLYLYLKFIAVMAANLPRGEDGMIDAQLKLNITGDEPRNIVPVDWVSEATCRIFCNPEARDRTYHLAPEHPITPREIIGHALRRFNARGVEYVGHTQEEQHEDEVSDVTKTTREHTTIYAPYETSDPQFDLTNLRKFVPDFSCPEIDDAILDVYWEYGEADRWGKRREPKPSLVFPVQSHLSALAEGKNASSNGTIIGLDVCGPGGGQWRLHLSEHQLVGIEAGLPADNSSYLQINVDDFATVAAGNSSSVAELKSLKVQGGLADSAASILLQLLR